MIIQKKKWKKRKIEVLLCKWTIQAKTIRCESLNNLIYIKYIDTLSEVSAMCPITSLNFFNFLKLIEVNTKQKLAKKIKDINQSFTEEQAIQIAHFLVSLSEVYYELEAKEKSNPKNIDL